MRTSCGIISAHLTRIGRQDQRKGEAWIVITAQNVIKKRGFCQIPLEQITLSNNVLKQNQGW